MRESESFVPESILMGGDGPNHEEVDSTADSALRSNAPALASTS